MKAVHGGWARTTNPITKILQSRWQAMFQRCRSFRPDKIRRYKNRGIAVCLAWKNFSTFKTWALQSGFASKLFLDRRNNNLGYSPNNCRWVTPKTSAENRETTRKTQCLETGRIYSSCAEASRSLGLTRYAIGNAINRGTRSQKLHWRFVS